MEKGIHIDLDINYGISVFDVLVVIIIMWSVYKGFKRGALVQSLSLFAFLAGLVISVGLTKGAHKFLTARSIIPDLFSSILFGILMGASVFGSHVVGDLVEDHAEKVEINPISRYLGIGFNAIKYLLMIGAFMLMLHKVNEYANFMPDRERNNKLGKGCSSIITTFFPYMKFAEESEHPVNLPDSQSDDDSKTKKNSVD